MAATTMDLREGTRGDRLWKALAAVPAPPFGVVLAPVDRLRSWLYQVVAPRARSLVVARDRRVAVVGSCLVVTALLSTSAWPMAFLALGPLVWGVPHIVSDLRYLVARPGFHRRPWVLAAIVAGILASVRFGVRGGIAGAAAAILCARAPVRRRALGVLCAGALFAVAQWAGPLGDLVFAHAHNAVGLGLWWAWRRRESRLHWVPIVLFAAGCALILTGALAPLAQATGGFVAPWTGLAVWSLAGGLSPVPWGPVAMRVLVLYAFAQSVHYVVWLRLVPEDDRPSPSPRSFVQSYRALRADVGPLVLWMALLTAAVLAGWAVVSVARARDGYLRMAFFHGYLELSAAALLWAEGAATIADRSRPLRAPSRR